VAAELADVAFTALVAITSLGHDPAATLAACAGKVTARISGTVPAVPDTHHHTRTASTHSTPTV
jgi:hypothetical protein